MMRCPDLSCVNLIFQSAREMASMDYRGVCITRTVGSDPEGLGNRVRHLSTIENGAS